jgi:hypothetical protein
MRDEHAQPPQYVVAHLRRAFAEDPRTAELGIRVTIRGDTVHLSGEVSSTLRKVALETVLREHLPQVTVRNDVHVVDNREPVEHEELD